MGSAWTVLSLVVVFGNSACALLVVGYWAWRRLWESESATPQAPCAPTRQSPDETTQQAA